MSFLLAVLSLTVFLPFSVSADVVEFSQSEQLGAVILDLYGMYNNTSLAYQYYSDGSALTEIVSLYNEYSQSASDPYTLAAIGAAAALAGTIAVVYDAISGKGYIQLYQEEYISSLDGFWDYTLSDLGFLRDQDGNFVWEESNGVVDSVFVVFVDNFISPPITSSSRSDVLNNGLIFAYNSSNQKVCISSSEPVFVCRVQDTSASTLYAFSTTSSPVIYRCTSSTGSSVSSYSPSLLTDSSIYRCAIGSSFSNSWNISSSIPVVSSLSSATSLFESTFGSPSSIVLDPSVYIGDPLQNPEIIEYPDPSSPDYAPRPVTIQTNVEWDDDWGTAPSADPTPGVPYPITDPATLNNLVPDLWSQIVAGSASVEAPQLDPSPDDPSGGSPSEVFIPLLPVTLPNFHFSFSGIWHYVRTWVQSLGSWMTMMFTVWSNLPYAMVVPVYATAVIVIVLGVYRRFFM